MPAFCGLEYEATAAGAIRYVPVRAPAGSPFGPWEVHPQKIAVEQDGRVRLEHNGDWLAHHESGHFFAFTGKWGGRASAEKFAALQNGDSPTRVVDLAEVELVSIHTKESVEAELAAKANAPNSP